MKLRQIIIAAVAALAMPVMAAGASSSNYLLYRTSLYQDMARVRIATFDASEGATFNQRSCLEAAALFQTLPIGERVRFWCERAGSQS